MKRFVVVAAIVALSAPACRETEGGVIVSSITFRGNRAVSSSELKAALATRDSGFLPWSRKYSFDRAELDRDVQRIETYYADRGYPNAKVENVDIRLNDAKDKVDVGVDITEGEPVVVERVELEGLDVIPADHRDRLLARLPMAAGRPRDQRLILASHELVLGELRDHGFPYGSVRALERPGSTATGVQLSLAVEPGPKAVFGLVTIAGAVSVDENIIRRELAFAEGDLYQLGRITETQRRLYGLELFQFANVAPRLPDDQALQVPVNVTLTEGKHRRLQFAAGYGSEEKARGRINWRHVNFFGGARTGELEARASSLEQGVRTTLLQPYVFQRGLSLRATGSTWWANEPVYEHHSSGGRVVIAKDFSRTGVGAERGVRNVISVSLIQEYEDYVVSPGALADPSFRDELIALGLNPETGRGAGTVAGFGLDFERSTSSQPLDPRQGYVVAGHMERAGHWLRGSFDYTELVGESRVYLPLASGFVWANRVRAGTLAGPSAASIPFYKRYFVGGSSSVRGWGRYQVSPLTPEGNPIGGRTSMELSTEARFRIRGKLRGVVFVDGGNAWNDPWAIRLRDLRWAVGPGFRYDTPIGPVRIDVGIQLNPIDGLLIEGEAERRKWRVHFSIGQAF